ncbi:small ribosomal subunit protein mS78 (rPPR3a)-like [Malania oleifera]|uniref:small ribosomal subunit protein mS78 (rPPR3a)-like n=1 Tax=Malania oleifera TaxID=397392 RepID=UPI0025AE9461|nr:small ribosomal subunit protein mS78 (rPPR3a)-like [Malania oleifera]
MSYLSRILRRTFSTSVSKTPETTDFITIKSRSQSLFKERNLKRLVQKFKESSEIDRFRTKTGVYEETVRRLASAKRFKWIKEILEDQKKYSDISREGFAVRLITLYGKSGMFDEASKTFDEMPERKCERTVKSLNALLGACVNSKMFDKLEEIFRELPSKLSVSPDVFSYNIIIKGYCDMGSLDLALSMLDEMEKNGVTPDLITFNTLLNEFCGKGQRLADAEKIWARMEAKNVVPDVRSYNAKLVGLASEKKMSEAVRLIEEMESMGIKADVFSFNALIKGFCNDEKMEEAKKWFDKMEASDCAPDKTTYATLVPAVCEKGDFSLALELCEKIFKRRRLVDVAVLQRVVDGLVKDSKIEEAKKLVELGKKNNYHRYNLKMPSDQ